MSKGNKSQLVYLLRMLQSAAKAIHYTSGYKTSEDFFNANDQMNFNATLLQIVNIGEQVAKLDDDVKGSNPNIEWQKKKALETLLYTIIITWMRQECSIL